VQNFITGILAPSPSKATTQPKAGTNVPAPLVDNLVQLDALKEDLPLWAQS
jgi:hypothetical protein